MANASLAVLPPAGAAVRCRGLRLPSRPPQRWALEAVPRGGDVKRTSHAYAAVGLVRGRRASWSELRGRDVAGARAWVGVWPGPRDGPWQVRALVLCWCGWRRAAASGGPSATPRIPNAGH